MTAEIVQFRRPAPAPANDVETKSAWGAPVGVTAWRCNCGCYEFYMTPVATHCCACHAPQVLG